MANKVLSIKMDEKDIERLRLYYELLVRTGFLSQKTTSLNAFYKHLLLDYLEDDINKAFTTYSGYGMSPAFINPDTMEENKSYMLANTYNLDSEMFEIYKKCLKELFSERVDMLKEDAKQFNKVVKSQIVVMDGWWYEMECFPCEDENEEFASFWGRKAFEMMGIQDEDYQKNEFNETIEMIEKSSVSEELKQKLIAEIEKYEKQRKQNYNLLQGRRGEN